MNGYYISCPGKVTLTIMLKADAAICHWNRFLLNFFSSSIFLFRCRGKLVQRNGDHKVEMIQKGKHANSNVSAAKSFLLSVSLVRIICLFCFVLTRWRLFNPSYNFIFFQFVTEVLGGKHTNVKICNICNSRKNFTYKAKRPFAEYFLLFHSEFPISNHSATPRALVFWESQSTVYHTCVIISIINKCSSTHRNHTVYSMHMI